MQETDLHDLSDDADYAASQQQGSASIMRSDSGRQSCSSSDSDGAEVVYWKDNVTIHPTQFASERISGRLKLIKQGTSLFMTWIPYKGQNSNARLSEKDRNLYTIRAVPFTEVRSVRRHTPALGWQYIIVVLSSGLAFPPLYFYNGGVKEFLATIKQHVFLVRSAEDANVFLVNDFQNPLQKTLSSLELPRVVSVASGESNVGESPLDQSQDRSGGNVRDGSLSISRYSGRPRQKAQDPARDLSIHVLEKFSLVTKFARETTSQIFGDAPNNGFGTTEKRNYNQSSIDYRQKPSNFPEKAAKETPVPSDPLEISFKLMFGKRRLCMREPYGGLDFGCWSSKAEDEGENGSVLQHRLKPVTSIINNARQSRGFGLSAHVSFISKFADLYNPWLPEVKHHQIAVALSAAIVVPDNLGLDREMVTTIALNCLRSTLAQNLGTTAHRKQCKHINLARYLVLCPDYLPTAFSVLLRALHTSRVPMWWFESQILWEQTKGLTILMGIKIEVVSQL
ncbi:hypothetical protein L484_008961 [Morus notabilis]|uniref:Small G protein signalling modulator 1/2 Rab-binding domain-containing protein n=1 Tax=Morus notabilis TaxID=981085 RepID=W9SAV6_9ROSA|nr:hypothetical protein L484_008961 [Morus notabilis]